MSQSLRVTKITGGNDMTLHPRNAIKLGAALVVALAFALSATLLPAQSGKTEVLWLGQATFKITTPSGKVIVTDPWLKGNPKTPADYKDLAKLGKVDLGGPTAAATPRSWPSSPAPRCTGRPGSSRS
jgi:hypothetical protein